MRTMMIVAVAAIFLAAMFILLGQQGKVEILHTYTNQNGNQLGDPNAPVTVIEYGDFQCSHCSDFFYETEAQFISTYVDTGKVLYEYRPLEFLGPQSGLAAQAALCAGDQNHFWEFHDMAFTSYVSAASFTEAKLLDLGTQLEMDQDAFAACLTNGDKEQQISEFHAQAIGDGVSGTPSFIVNGEFFGGNIPFETLSSAIENALNN